MKKIFFDTKIKAKYDIAKLNPEFPTAEKAEKQKERYIRILLNSMNPEDRELGKWMKLLKCRKNRYCGQAICPVCMRLYQRWYCSELIRIAKKHPDAMFITIVLGDRFTKSADLWNLSLKTLKNRVIGQFRSDMPDVIVVGGAELDYDYDLGYWVPHFHLLVIGSSEEGREAFERFYTNRQHPRLIKTMKWDGSAHLLSYLLKSYSKRRKQYLGITRLDRKELIVELHFRAKYKCHKFAFLRRAKRIGSRIELLR